MDAGIEVRGEDRDEEELAGEKEEKSLQWHRLFSSQLSIIGCFVESGTWPVRRFLNDIVIV